MVECQGYTHTACAGTVGIGICNDEVFMVCATILKVRFNCKVVQILTH